MRNSRWLSLVVLCTGFLLIVVDMTIVNVALPSIQVDMGFSPSGLAWVVNAYLIAFGGLLLLAGRLGDLIGRKRILMTGLVVFTGASLLCGLSWSPEMLIAARFVQGVGGAMSSAVILGMIVTMFPEPGDQARAIGVYSFVASAGASIGLLAGGILTQAVGWHSIFLVSAFIARQTTAANPILPLGMFRSRNVSGANLVQFLMVAGLLGFFFISALYLRLVLGLRPLEIGLAFLPVAIAIGALSLGLS